MLAVDQFEELFTACEDEDEWSDVLPDRDYDPAC